MINTIRVTEGSRRFIRVQESPKRSKKVKNGLERFKRVTKYRHEKSRGHADTVRGSFD